MEETSKTNETAQLGIDAVIDSAYHQGINDSIKTIESILDYKSNTKWGRALRFAVNQIESLKKENSGWIKLNGVAGEMEDCDCWVLDSSGNIFFSEQGQFIPIGLYKYYMPISKPTILPDGF